MICRIIQFRDVHGKIHDLLKLLRQYFSTMKEKEFVFEFALFPSTRIVVKSDGEQEGVETEQWVIRLRFINQDQLDEYEASLERLQFYADLEKHGVLGYHQSSIVIDYNYEENMLEEK